MPRVPRVCSPPGLQEGVLASRVALKSAKPPEGSATPEPEKEEEATALTFRGTFSVFDDL